MGETWEERSERGVGRGGKRGEGCKERQRAKGARVERDRENVSDAESKSERHIHREREV